MYCGHARLCVCLSAAVRPHYWTYPDVTWGRGRGCPLVVHYWMDLQSGHGLHFSFMSLIYCCTTAGIAWLPQQHKCWNKLVFLIMRFVIFIIYQGLENLETFSSRPTLRLFLQDKTKTKTKSFISRPRPRPFSYPQGASRPRPRSWDCIPDTTLWNISVKKIPILKIWVYEASCHAKLSHSKQLLKFLTVILALLSSLTKRYTDWPY